MTLVRYRRGFELADCQIAVGQIMTGLDRKSLWIVIRAEEPIDTEEGQKPWSQEYEARLCTAEEAADTVLALRIARLRREQRILQGCPDDERDRDQIKARRAEVAAELVELTTT